MMLFDIMISSVFMIWNAENYYGGWIMKKTLSVLLVFIMLSVTGCNLLKIAGGADKGERPYGSLYDDAKDWATYWCGPCKQLDKETVPNDPHDIELYTMKDKEYGFEYQVEAMYFDYSTSIKPEPSYTYGNFDYEYLKVFMEETDFSDLIEKYDLTVELEEITLGQDGKLYNAFYSPTINFNTDLELDEDDINEILSFTYHALQDFDKKREHFTRNEYCKTVYFYVWCAPSEHERELGHVRGGDHGIFGYRTENR